RATREESVPLLHRDPRREPQAGEDVRRATLGDERATLLHELIERLHPFGSGGSADIIGRIGGAERRELRRLLVRDGAVAAAPRGRTGGISAAATTTATTAPGRRSGATGRIDDHVILGAEISLLEERFAEVLERHAIVIEGRTHPPLVLGARPAVHI